MREIQKVLVLGATGNVGRLIVDALIAASFTVAVSTRRPHADDLNFPPSVSVEAADLEDTSSLAAAFAGQDAIVEAFNPAAARFQINIVDAALQSEVRHIITPDFGSNTFHVNAPELKIFEPKIKAQRLLEERLKGSEVRWTAIITGPFFDWAIPRDIFWVNVKERKVTLFGSGSQRVSMSRLNIVGRATVAVLSDPIAYANRPAYFADYTLSTKELLGLLEEVPPGWKVDNVPVENLLRQGLQQWEVDTANGVDDQLNSVAYMVLGTYGIFEEANRYGADFGEKIGKGWEQGQNELRQDLQKLIANGE